MMMSVTGLLEGGQRLLRAGEIAGLQRLAELTEGGALGAAAGLARSAGGGGQIVLQRGERLLGIGEIAGLNGLRKAAEISPHLVIG